MKDSLRNIMFGTLVGLVVVVISWPGLLFLFGCASTDSCSGEHLPEMTSIPTLVAATMPAPKVGAEAAAARPTCHIAAVNLIGAWVTGGSSETASFPFTDEKGATCTATFKDDVQKLFVTPNLWFTGAPACITCHYADVKKATMNMDLSSYTGILAGSHRANGEPKGNDILGGGNWDQALLHKMLFAPDGKTQLNPARPAMPLGRPATVPADGPIISAGTPGGSAAEPTVAPATDTDIAHPSNPGDAGEAVKLTGDPAKGADVFSANCAACHGEQGKGGIANPGSGDGTVPPLNPIDSTLVNTDAKVFTYNLDLFLEHGSTPEGDNPTLKMPAWGDSKKLSPQQIADAIAYVISLNQSTAASTPTVEIARPSNPGDPGDAINLTGDATSGAALFKTNCVVCHGDQGKGGVENSGSTDGTVPELNPIDSTLVNADYKTFASNIDLFIQHGSTPEGDKPAKLMPAWGDKSILTQQQIADLIAFVVSLNQPAPAEEIARPSNPGGAGLAVALTGDAASGKLLFATNCAVCHGAEGIGNIPNPGSDDGTVPPLNPIDSTLVSTDGRVFGYNLDLFLEHGSTPEGSNPTLKMPAWGDTQKLLPQEIADLIAYLLSLNSPK